MPAKEPHKKVKINITTYAKPKRKYTVEMNKHYGSRNDNSRFICSICLNTNARNEKNDDFKNHESDKRKSKSCPMCQREDTNNESKERNNKTDKVEIGNSRNKTLHASKVNVDHGLNLLTEVLTVFQSQKENNVKERNSKPIILKDACVSAEFGKTKPKLSVSKTFQLSIEGGGIQESGKFVLVNACQPKVAINSQCSIDLIKHKSSSIPQMKMEELKNSLKEKNKSNNPMEEVNRMFATVKRDGNFDNVNRPLIRNGPRVLPVVKTFSEKPSERQSDGDSSDQSHRETCKCCQNNQNYYMSSGDSLAKKERCEKSVAECCNKSHCRVQKEKDKPICERCRKPSYGFD